ncbi:ATP-binding protein [Streptomyces sp. NBC_01304]|uniref:ATP-binding protein n=1 Tax=Streptomyces sp. NBC_01304 TaxID=2903818 RepID=UPI002E10553F|nr:NB-ARC domain-containing protein [Streptomyces sp. NBC_01304]
MPGRGQVRERGNLPDEATPFIGRAAELRDVSALFAEDRFVTLTGPGGVGKTRIALRAAAALTGQLADGAWLVELSAVLHGRHVAQAVSRALGAADQTSRPLLDVLVDYLRGRELLLVLDTCEHLVEECGRLARLLLDAAPGLRILVTSRQALDVPGERVLTIGPMETALGGDAITMLRARIQEASAAGTLRRHSNHELAQVCALLDGIPLALELAAAPLRTMPADLFIGHLARRMSVLSPDGFDEPSAPDHLDDTGQLATRSRHAGLRTTIGWSHEWCTSEERLLWARLAVFPGSFDILAVDFVCTGDPLFGFDLTDVLNSLIAKSIVLREGVAGARRYRMLDTIREYGAEWLERIGEARRLRLRHRDYYRHLAMSGYEEWIGPDQPAWCARMTVELPNLRAAMDTCLDTSVGASLDMAGDLLFFWFCCGHLREGRHYTEAALALDPTYEGGRARALWSCGLLAMGQGDLDDALQLAVGGQDLAERVDDEMAAAGSLYVQAGALTLQGDTAGALPKYAQAHEGAARTGPDLVKLVSLASWSYAHMMRGEAAEVRAKVQRLKDLSGAIGEIWAGAYGDFVLGNLSIVQGRHGEALTSLRTALEAKSLLDDLYGTAVTLDSMARAAVGAGRAGLAAGLLGLGDKAWGILGTPHLGAPEMVEHRRLCEEQTRAALGSARFERQYRAGFAVESVSAGVRQVLGSIRSPDPTEFA